MAKNYSLWRKTLSDVKIIDVIMLLFLFFTMAFLIYVHYTPVQAETGANQEKSK
jgi:hypothetical protein